VLEYRVLRKIYGTKRDEVEGGEYNIMMSFVTCTLSQV
jgi:hypothetical protein